MRALAVLPLLLLLLPACAGPRAGADASAGPGAAGVVEPIPHAEHPPVPLDFPTQVITPMDFALRPLETDDWAGTAGVFMRLAEDSETEYVVELAPGLPPDAADELLGPVSPYPTQARPWAVVRREGELALVADRLPAAPAEPYFVEAELALRDGDHAAALERYRKVTELDPGLPKGWVHRAEAAVALGLLDEAAEAIARGLELSPVDPMAHTVQAELRLRRGDPAGARRALASALALYPDFPPALALVEAASGRAPTWQPLRPPVRIRPDGSAVHIAVDAEEPESWIAWAACQATTRFEPDRSRLPFDELPFGVFPKREVTCAMSLVDAAMARGGRGRRIADPAVSRLVEIARAGFLGEAIVYDIIGPRFPALLLGLSDAQRARLAVYVDLFVLPR